MLVAIRCYWVLWSACDICYGFGHWLVWIRWHNWQVMDVSFDAMDLWNGLMLVGWHVLRNCMRSRWKWHAFNARHSILPPLDVTLAWLLFNCFFLWLSFDIQARKELLDQAQIFKDIWLQVCFFHYPWTLSVYEIDVGSVMYWYVLLLRLETM